MTKHGLSAMYIEMMSRAEYVQVHATRSGQCIQDPDIVQSQQNVGCQDIIESRCCASRMHFSIISKTGFRFSAQRIARVHAAKSYLETRDRSEVPWRSWGHCPAARKADTAERLAAFFGTDAQSWMNLQAHHDTELAKERIGTEFLAKNRQHAVSP